MDKEREKRVEATIAVHQQVTKLKNDGNLNIMYKWKGSKEPTRAITIDPGAGTAPWAL